MNMRAGLHVGGLRCTSQSELVNGGAASWSHPTLRGIDLMVGPHIIPDQYQPEVIWDGLGMIGFSIVPHDRSDRLLKVESD